MPTLDLNKIKIYDAGNTVVDRYIIIFVNQKRKEQAMEKIAEAIQESISRGSIVHVTVDADDIYDAMYGVDFDGNVHIQDFGKDFHDVWGADNGGNTWRLNVTLKGPEETK